MQNITNPFISTLQSQQSSNSRPDLDSGFENSHCSAMEVQSLGLAHGQGKPEQQGRWRIWTEVRRREGGVGEGMFGDEADRARRGEERMGVGGYIERKRRSMYSQWWPQQPWDVAPVHLHWLLKMTLLRPRRKTFRKKQLVENRIWYKGCAVLGI